MKTMFSAIIITLALAGPASASGEIACWHAMTGVIQMFPCCTCPMGWGPA